MAGFRGSNAQRGKCSYPCNHYQAVIGAPGTWSCLGRADGTDCDKCKATNTITFAEQFCDPKNFTDGNPQDCGPKTKPFSAECQGQVCVGGDWSSFSCQNPDEAVAQ